MSAIGSALPPKSLWPSGHRLPVSIGIVACVAGCLAFALILLGMPGGAHVVKLFDDIAGTVVTFVVGLWCLEGIRNRTVSRESIGLGFAALLCATAHGIHIYGDILSNHAGALPEWANAGYLILYPILLIGLVKLPTRSQPVATTRIAIDSLMTITALVTFSWYYFLGPALIESRHVATGLVQESERIAFSSYPFANLILTFCLLVFTVTAREHKLRKSVWIACAGFAATCIADFGYGFMASHFSAAIQLTRLGWPVGYGLIALAALVARREILSNGDTLLPDRHWDVDMGGGGWSNLQADLETAGSSALHRIDELTRRQRKIWQILLPYLFVPPLVALVAYVATHDEDRTLAAGVYIGSSFLLFLILLRQVFVIMENNRLTENLNQAYRELQTIHEALETRSRTLENDNERLEGLAATDGMTGLANHRKFQERLRDELACSPESGKPCSLLIMDVDHFKQYNDSFGHPAGDSVLRTVANLARESVRPSDLVARYGGEEFAVVLPETEARFAMLVAERIRSRIEAHPFECRAITVSIGACTAPTGLAAATVIADADSALYESKRGGRNRVTLHSL